MGKDCKCFVRACQWQTKPSLAYKVMNSMMSKEKESTNLSATDGRDQWLRYFQGFVVESSRASGRDER